MQIHSTRFDWWMIVKIELTATCFGSSCEIIRYCWDPHKRWTFCLISSQRWMMTNPVERWGFINGYSILSTSLCERVLIHPKTVTPMIYECLHFNGQIPGFFFDVFFYILIRSNRSSGKNTDDKFRSHKTLFDTFFFANTRFFPSPQ